MLALKDLKLEIKRGQFVCIIGDVGSGKSSLLSAVIGDMLHLSKAQKEEVDLEMVSRVSQTPIAESDAPIEINGSISYVQQSPWIQNKTIKDNILFGRPFDSQKYRKVIKICELTRDLEILPAGDQTEIGEKGINLSGGQKARLSLARAVYANKDIILMDDPISALDANVKKQIFEKVFVGALKSKTRVLVTHAVDFIHLVDEIILIKDGRIILQGHYNEVKDHPYITQLKQIHDSHKQEVAEEAKQTGTKEMSRDESDSEEKEEGPSAPQMVEQHNMSTDFDIDQMQTEAFHQSLEMEEEEAQEKERRDQDRGKIIKQEQEEDINVTMKTYRNYFGNYWGRWGIIFQFAFIMVAFTGLKTWGDYIIGQWSESKHQKSELLFFGGLSMGLSIAVSFLVAMRSYITMFSNFRATKKLHSDMLKTVFNAPVNLYFDITPIGSILNRFSKDLN